MTRDSDTHVHRDYQTIAAQHRYEDRIEKELGDISKAVERLTQRVTMLLGAIALLVFVLPILAPFIRAWVGLP